MLVYDRKPESVRMVSRVFAAGRDSRPRSSAADPRIEVFLARRICGRSRNFVLKSSLHMEIEHARPSTNAFTYYCWSAAWSQSLPSCPIGGTGSQISQGIGPFASSNNMQMDALGVLWERSGTLSESSGKAFGKLWGHSGTPWGRAKDVFGTPWGCLRTFS